jgi:hypothetical protein
MQANVSFGSTGAGVAGVQFNDSATSLSLNPTADRGTGTLTVGQLLSAVHDERILTVIVKNFLLNQDDFLFTVTTRIEEKNIRSVQWSEWSFGQVSAESQPELTASRVTSSPQANQHFKALERVGRATQVSHDLMKTEEGQMLWMAQIEQTASSIMMTMKLDLLRTLQSCKPYSEFLKQHVPFTEEITIPKILQAEIAPWGIMSRDPYGLDLLVAHQARTMEQSAEGAMPDHLILPPRSQEYMKNQKGNTRNYMSHDGPDAVQRQKDYPYKRMPVAKVAEIDAYETSTYSPAYGFPGEDPLTKNVQIGEKFFMSTLQRKRRPDDLVSGDIWIYCPSSDMMERISFREAFLRCGLFGAEHGFSVDVLAQVADDHNKHASDLTNDRQTLTLQLNPFSFVSKLDNENYQIVPATHFGKMENGDDFGEFIPFLIDATERWKASIFADSGRKIMEILVEGLPENRGTGLDGYLSGIVITNDNVTDLTNYIKYMEDAKKANARYGLTGGTYSAFWMTLFNSLTSPNFELFFKNHIALDDFKNFYTNLIALVGIIQLDFPDNALIPKSLSDEQKLDALIFSIFSPYYKTFVVAEERINVDSKANKMVLLGKQTTTDNKILATPTVLDLSKKYSSDVAGINPAMLNWIILINTQFTTKNVATRLITSYPGLDKLKPSAQFLNVVVGSAPLNDDELRMMFVLVSTILEGSSGKTIATSKDLDDLLPNNPKTLQKLKEKQNINDVLISRKVDYTSNIGVTEDGTKSTTAFVATVLICENATVQKTATLEPGYTVDINVATTSIDVSGKTATSKTLFVIARGNAGNVYFTASHNFDLSVFRPKMNRVSDLHTIGLFNELLNGEQQIEKHDIQQTEMDRFSKQVKLTGIHKNGLDFYYAFDGPSFLHKLQRVWNDVSNLFQRAFVVAFLCQRCDSEDYWLRLLAENIPVPITVTLLRPHMEFRMSNGIVMKKGDSTVRTYMGYVDTSIGYYAKTKEDYCHITARLASIILRPANVSVLPAIKYSSYEGGGNSQFFERIEDLGLHVSKRPSLYAVATSYKDKGNLSYMDICGKWQNHPIYQWFNLNMAEENRHSSYSTHPIYCRKWDWENNFNVLSDPNTFNYTDKSKFWNRVCCQGLQVSWSVSEQKFSNITKSKGHLGDEGSMPGALKVFNQRQHYFDPPNYNDLLKLVNK